HLLRIAHQFIKVDFWSGDERADSSAALYHTFPLERGQGVTRGHEADLMKLCQVPFRRNGVACAQVSGFNPPPETDLNPPVGRQSIGSTLSLHALSRGLGGQPSITII